MGWWGRAIGMMEEHWLQLSRLIVYRWAMLLEHCCLQSLLSNVANVISYLAGNYDVINLN